METIFKFNPISTDPFAKREDLVSSTEIAKFYMDEVTSECFDAQEYHFPLYFISVGSDGKKFTLRQRQPEERMVGGYCELVPTTFFMISLTTDKDESLEKAKEYIMSRGLDPENEFILDTNRLNGELGEIKQGTIPFGKNKGITVTSDNLSDKYRMWIAKGCQVKKNVFVKKDKPYIWMTCEMVLDNKRAYGNAYSNSDKSFWEEYDMENQKSKWVSFWKNSSTDTTPEKYQSLIRMAKKACFDRGLMVEYDGEFHDPKFVEWLKEKEKREKENGFAKDGHYHENGQRIDIDLTAETTKIHVVHLHKWEMSIYNIHVDDKKYIYKDFGNKTGHKLQELHNGEIKALNLRATISHGNYKGIYQTVLKRPRVKVK